MSSQNFTQQLTKTVDELSKPQTLQGLFHEHRDGDPLPSSKELEEIIELTRSILFPGFYGMTSVNIQTIRYRIGVDTERLNKLLCRQVMAGLCSTRIATAPMLLTHAIAYRKRQKGLLKTSS